MEYFKWLVIFLFGSSILLFIPMLFIAVTTESLEEGLVKIRNNPWALAAFSDFTVGFIFNLTLICVREGSDLYQVPGRRPSYWSAFFWVMFALLVGNPAVLSYGIYQLIKAPNIKDAFLVTIGFDKTPSHTTTTKWLYWLFQLGMGGLLIYYVVSCLIALSSQSITSGWEYIQSDPWAYLTFFDNLLGILFTSVYMAVSQHPKWIHVIGWWLSLWLLGNGVTAIFAFQLCWRKYSIGESLVYRE
ncbi:hypothetical protein GpartN1_g5915.t1 [Galdieria partita]|uniref:Uncharacterized protein n=1 Tax=Galdieria partita TaxID=83374 RepID=A0A9C7USG3_9RHOD|nr:hypothetical protein GpartN1_g5915.t1 [Galdieria partita]